MSLETALLLNLYSVIILVVILYNLYRKYGINDRITKIFLYMIYITIAMLIFDGLGRFDGLSRPYFVYFNKIGNTISFILNSVLPSLYFLFILEIVSINKIKKRIFLSIAVFIFLIFSTLSIISVFSTNDNYLFYINEDNIYMRGKLFFLTVMYTGLLLLGATLIVFINRKKVDRRLFTSLFFFPIPPIIGIILQSIFYGTSLICLGVTISALFVHMHLQAIQMNTDYLTKIYNRRKLIFKLKDLILKAKPDKTFTGILIDIVEFKNINDSYGHQFGDLVLIKIAEILNNVIGSKNWVYRYGGDEFFIILNSSKKEVAFKYIEKINDELTSFKDSKDNPFKIELTFGCLVYDPIEKLSVNEFLETIDQLMYSNKKYVVADK
ncbi:MAG: GGDEF domain-containing protein [Bacilli bacterium]|nr:GGDEF domain-containing protein [Bacilli bacterium]MDD2682271.1 GGDEF domain-containing protein [Bacilli bacterium]MDD3121082.1 GGDEF domain-containing protein [Bacilli bacterium]MDD4063780.1 GGDEF domain-containing protein [Bacilli bacterium]MDD5183330.1 GGDEF domain-containing protein [Bacilli bacterium]